MEEDRKAGVTALLTAAEQAEMAKLKQEPMIVGHAVFTKEGEEIEAEGVWDETAPIFANVFDLADRIGKELGEERDCRVVVADNPEFELSAIALTAAHAVVLKRKSRTSVGGLRSVR